MAEPTREQVEKWTHMTADTLDAVSGILKHINEVDDPVTPAGSDLYISGSLAVRHSDGYRVGWVSSFDDWWVFVPDYAEGEDG